MSHEPQTSDPLQVLPYEIWVEVVEFTIVDSADGPLSLLAVSSKWSDAILSTPSLWTTIVLNQDEDEIPRIHSFIFLSQTLPLNVIVLLPFSDKATLARLAQEASRIISLSIMIKNSGGVENDTLSRQASQMLEQVVKDDRPYPEMKSLEVDQLLSPALPKNFLQNCPNLSYFRCTPLHEYSLGNGHTSSFYRYIPPKKALQFYQHTNLRSLSLFYRSFPSDDDAWTEHLEELALAPTGRLRELKIALPAKQVAVLFLLLAAFPRLHTLDLQFYFGDGTIPNTLSLNPSDISSVRNLSIDSISPFGASVEQYGRLLRLFTEHTALINLDTLSFNPGSCPCNATQINALLRSAINVRVLKLNLGSGAESLTETVPEGLQVPLLTRLYSVSLSPALLIYHLIVPNATHVSLEGNSDKLPLTRGPNLGAFVSRLIIPSVDFDSINEDLSPNEIASRWSNLRYIQLGSKYAWRSAASLMSLHVVEFSRPRKVGVYQPGLNNFLLELLKSRGSCPRLVAIKSSDYPCWGLLSEVLRCRISSQLCRITHVTLPAYPTFPILSHLVSLLQGNSSHVGWEDIDTAIMRRFEEHADTSCVFCIQAGYFNCSYSKPESSPAPYALTYDWPPDPPIKPDHDIDTTRDDYIYWEDILQPLKSVGNGRTSGWNFCSQHPGGAEISGYTLEGISSVEYIRGSNESGKVPGK